MPNIKSCQAAIRDLIKQDIEENENFQSLFPGPGPGPGIKEITQYAMNSGKRLRPMIIWSMGQARHFTLFIEYAHNASLVVDDLPCMDNDTVRRGQSTIHAKYGEHVAQLVAYNMMITAMKHLSDGFRNLKEHYTTEQFDQVYDMVNDEVNRGLSYQGICGGQFLDLLICTDRELQNKPKREQRELVIKIMKLKTGCLFSIAYILGWLSLGRPVEYIDDIKEAGYSFGIAYQIIDDLKDVQKDVEKNNGYNNICRYFTRNEIIDMFADHMEQFSTVMTQYELWNPTILEIYNYMLLSFKSEIKKST